MFRKLKLATAIVLAISAFGTMSSAEAHIGALVRGARNGGGGPRAKQSNNANANRIPANAGVVVSAKPLPKTSAAAPAGAPTGGTSNSTGSQPLVAVSSTTNKPNAVTVVGSNSIVKTSIANVPAKVVAAAEPKSSKPSMVEIKSSGRLIFNLPNAVLEETDPNETTPAAQPKGLPIETQKALEDVIATEAPAAESTPSEAKSTPTTTEFVSKEVALPQIPVGATVTLNGKDLSTKEGQVVLQIGEIALPATINDWKNDLVTCTLPVIGMTRPTKATLHVLKADGKTASILNCELVTTLTTSVEAKPKTGSIDAAKYEQ